MRVPPNLNPKLNHERAFSAATRHSRVGKLLMCIHAESNTTQCRASRLVVLLAQSACLPCKATCQFVTAGLTDRRRMRSNWFQQNEKIPLPPAQSPFCSLSCTTAATLKPRPWSWAGCAQHFNRRTSPCIFRKLFFLKLLCVCLVWR